MPGYESYASRYAASVGPPPRFDVETEHNTIRDPMTGVMFRRPPRLIDPDELLAAVETMDESQRARLAEMLGIPRRSPWLWLPGDGREFVAPTERNRDEPRHTRLDLT
jgi:hypothetical protein